MTDRQRQRDRQTDRQRLLPDSFTCAEGHGTFWHILHFTVVIAVTLKFFLKITKKLLGGSLSVNNVRNDHFRREGYVNHLKGKKAG